MPGLKWGLKKDIPENSKFVVATDLYENNGAKNFADLQSFDNMCTFFEDNKNKSYYQVIISNDIPVFMYFDIDVTGPHKEKEENTIFTVFIKTLETFLELNHDTKISFIPGENCQITSSSRPGKCSLHFIAYILFQNTKQHSRFAFNLCNYIIEHNITELFYIKDETRVFYHAIDASVYTSFRTFRMTYMCKKGINSLLLPVYNSSTKMRDYIISYYQKHSRKYILKLDNIELKSLEHVLSYNCPKLLGDKKKHTENNLPHYSMYMDFIQNSNEIKDMLDVDSIDTQYVYDNYEDENYYILFIKRNIRPKCPFACKVHKSNNITLHCHKIQHFIKLKCFNEECIGKNIIFNVLTKEAMYKQSIDNTRIDTLHSMYHNIPWSDNYDEPTMKPYPKGNLVCIRGNMGVGKTESLKEFLKKALRGDGKTALIITFSRSLSEKYYNDFKDLKFTNYLLEPQNKHIDKERVIICLDSIMRVKLIKYDYIIVDEALSVFMHMNSPLMKNSTTVCNYLQTLLFQCHHLYMLDACMDNIFMYNVANYLKSKRKNTEEICWINNSYVRKTNRYAVLQTMTGYIYSNKASANPLMYDAITKIKSLLNEGKKVVVPSSTRSFALTLTDILKSEYPDKVILTYSKDNKDNEEDEEDEEIVVPKNQQHSIDISKWNTADVLIYSPTISAGVSYIEDHFDCLVAYIVNSNRTPTVDIVLQQLFRVRKLNEGGMFLYVMEQPPTSFLSTTEYDVEEYLNNRYTLSTKYTNEYNGVKFDSVCDLTSYKKDLFSYEILKGIHILHNRSRVFFVDILKNTLEQDYNIMVSTQKNNNKPTTEYDVENEEIVNEELPEFADDLIITQTTYERLADEKFLDKRDKLKFKTYNILVDFYGLRSSNINKELFDKYVSPNNAYEMVEVILRWYNAVYNNYNMINSDSVYYLTTLKNSKEDFNFLLYKNVTLKNINKLLTSLRLLCITLGNTSWKEDIKEFKTIKVDLTKIENSYLTFLNDYHEQTKKEIFSNFNMSASVKPFFGFKKIIGEGIGLSVERICFNKTRKHYNTIVLKTYDYIEYLFKNYNPSLRINYSNYC